MDSNCCHGNGDRAMAEVKVRAGPELLTLNCTNTLSIQLAQAAMSLEVGLQTKQGCVLTLSPGTFAGLSSSSWQFAGLQFNIPSIFSLE